MADRTRRLGEAVFRALDGLVRERLARKPGGHLIESRLGGLELRIPLRSDGEDPARFAEGLRAAIDELLDEAVHSAASFRPGHAYCHRCSRVDCEHSLPPSCRHVFVGYAPTGLPRWEDFAQHCLERRHPQVDRLYAEPPALVTLVQEGEALRAGMLRAFQDPSCELLGQLVAGFFSVRTRLEEGRGVLALTIQVVASGSDRGWPRLGLNLLGRTPAGGSLELLQESRQELPWRNPVRWAQAALQTVAPVEPGPRSRRPSRETLQRRALGILAGLERRLAREQRARSRRTRHAEVRHASGVRPTRKAVDDARTAGGDALLVDERSGTLVVLGQRGRVHFFTAGGQHVSSVRYSRDAIEKKLSLELWIKAPPEQVEAFRRSLPS